MLDTFGQRLAQLLSARGLTQGEFAKGLEASPSFISDMIRGVKKPGAEFLVRLAVQYQASLDWLLLGKGSMDGQSSIDAEWLRTVVLRVELARLAANGDDEARILIEELLGRNASPASISPARQALLDQLAQTHAHTALISTLYNGYIAHPDAVIRAREVLTAALAHFRVQPTDPLAAMVSSRGNKSTPDGNEKVAQVNQLVYGSGNRTAGGNYHER